MSIIDSIRARLGTRSPKVVHATSAAAHTVSDDLARSSERVAIGNTEPAITALALRGVASARSRTRGRAARLSRKAAKAGRLRQQRVDYQERRTERLSHPRAAERLEHAIDHDVRSARIGYLASWLPSFVVVGLAMGMVANDPPFVAATLRRTFDVPESTLLWAVWDPNVLVSLAAAVVVTIVLLGNAHLMGKAGASLLFRGPLLRGAHPQQESLRASEVLPVGRSVAILAVGGAVMTFFVWFLHTIAAERFTGGITAAFSGGAGLGVEFAVTAFVTWLPVAVVLMEVVANHPVFVHTRRAASWSLFLRLTERHDIRRDERFATRMTAALRQARVAMAELADMIADVALRVQAEHVEGAIRTGKLETAAVLKALSAPSSPESVSSSEPVPMPRIDTSGQVLSGVFSTSPISNRVIEAISAFRAVDEADEIASIAQIWATKRKAATPSHGSGDESLTDGATTPPPGPHPVTPAHDSTTDAAVSAA